MMRESPSFETVLAAAVMPASPTHLASSSTLSKIVHKPYKTYWISLSCLGDFVLSVNRNI
jgi:hypothetical protein